MHMGVCNLYVYTCKFDITLTSILREIQAIKLKYLSKYSVIITKFFFHIERSKSFLGIIINR